MNKNRLPFQPGFGLASKELQMILANFLLPAGDEPPSQPLHVDIGAGDALCCHVSTPNTWKHGDPIVILIHGVGGSHASKYMVRMSRKLFEQGKKVVRMNLRNCGSGRKLSKLPYCAGNSGDLFHLVERLNGTWPSSLLQIVGYSLGGNIVLKLAGELGARSAGLIDKVVAVCPPLCLETSVREISKAKYRHYHAYYLSNMKKQSKEWHPGNFGSIYEFDDKFTGPMWGFKNAREYYSATSCGKFLKNIACQSHIVFSEDDPFVPLDAIDRVAISNQVNIWTTQYGGHMGFIGAWASPQSMHWLDGQILNWMGEEKYTQTNSKVGFRPCQHP